MSSWRTGLTTDACAGAATKAAVMALRRDASPEQLDIPAPDGTRVTLPTTFVGGDASSVSVAVRNDVRDDPDVTDGCMVTASVEWSDGGDVTFVADDGVGVVTKLIRLGTLYETN